MFNKFKNIIKINHQTHSYCYQILHLQRSLEKSLSQIFSSSNNDETLETLITNLTDYIPLICALDQYYESIRLLFILYSNTI
jgi:hypothetical protein